ncbi:hypothetical protein D3C75_666320 [compost metagenome]
MRERDQAIRFIEFSHRDEFNGAIHDAMLVSADLIAGPGEIVDGGADAFGM